MTEPDVTLTDFALALLCAIFALLVGRTSRPPMRRWWIIFFGGIAVSAFCGALVHGWFNDRGTTEWAILWRVALLAVGLTSTATWSLGAYLQQGDRLGAAVRKAAIGFFVVYALIILTVSSSFFVAVLFYLPATLFMLVAIVDAYRRSPTRAEAYGIAGLVITIVAAVLQQLRFSIHSQYFDHNALYHALQAIALFCLFVAARVVRPASVREVLSEPAL